MTKIQKDKKTKWQKGKIAKWQNGNMAKKQKYKRTKWQNGKKKTKGPFSKILVKYLGKGFKKMYFLVVSY